MKNITTAAFNRATLHQDAKLRKSAGKQTDLSDICKAFGLKVERSVFRTTNKIVIDNEASTKITYAQKNIILDHLNNCHKIIHNPESSEDDLKNLLQTTKNVFENIIDSEVLELEEFSKQFLTFIAHRDDKKFDNKNISFTAHASILQKFLTELDNLGFLAKNLDSNFRYPSMRISKDPSSIETPTCSNTEQRYVENNVNSTQVDTILNNFRYPSMRISKDPSSIETPTCSNTEQRYVENNVNSTQVDTILNNFRYPLEGGYQQTKYLDTVDSNQTKMRYQVLQIQNDKDAKQQKSDDGVVLSRKINDSLPLFISQNPSNKEIIDMLKDVITQMDQYEHMYLYHDTKNKILELLKNNIEELNTTEAVELINLCYNVFNHKNNYTDDNWFNNQPNDDLNRYLKNLLDHAVKNNRDVFMMCTNLEFLSKAVMTDLFITGKLDNYVQSLKQIIHKIDINDHRCKAKICRMIERGPMIEGVCSYTLEDKLQLLVILKQVDELGDLSQRFMQLHIYFKDNIAEFMDILIYLLQNKKIEIQDKKIYEYCRFLLKQYRAEIDDAKFVMMQTLLLK